MEPGREKEREREREREQTWLDITNVLSLAEIKSASLRRHAVTVGAVESAAL
jgi:hypothetical protein